MMGRKIRFTRNANADRSTSAASVMPKNPMICAANTMMSTHSTVPMIVAPNMPTASVFFTRCHSFAP